MRYSRTGIVAVLLAAEVFLAGAIYWVATGGRGGAWAQAQGLHQVDEAAKTFAPIDAGKAPHVVVDDPDSRVIVTASNDGQVHVTDNSRSVGWVWGTSHAPPLTVSRTADGVEVRRAESDSHLIAVIGFDYRHTEVAVPANSRIEISRCGGADLDGVQASDLKIACGDGSIRLHNVQSPAIDASTDDGSIRGDLQVGGGRLQSADGSIRLALAQSNLTVHARTADGSIRINGERVRSGDSDGAQYQFGTGGGSLQVSTQDGSINISTNGALVSHE